MTTGDELLLTRVVESLKRFSIVPVKIDCMEGRMKVTLSRPKLEQVIRSYGKIYDHAHKCRWNRPMPPCDETAYAFAWKIAPDG